MSCCLAGGAGGMEVLRAVKQRSPETAVVMITAFGSEKIAVEAMKLGAADYVPKPFESGIVAVGVARAPRRPVRPACWS